MNLCSFKNNIIGNVFINMDSCSLSCYRLHYVKVAAQNEFFIVQMQKFHICPFTLYRISFSFLFLKAVFLMPSVQSLRQFIKQ